MSWKGSLSGKPFISKFLVFGGVCLLSMTLFTLLGLILASYLFDLDLIFNKDLLNHYEDVNVINALKLIQTFSAIGLFIVPSILCSWIFSKSPLDYIYMRRRPGILLIFLVVIVLFSAVPLINWMVYLNQQLALPSFMWGIENWMKASEKQAAQLTEAFLKTSSLTGLFANLIIIGLIPAIGEELLFRGVLQRLLSESMKNKHLPIIISAFVFSAMHMQFYGFFPRMMLGILFGYFLLWSNSLWLPIIGHFINNAAAVIFAFYAAKENMPFDQDTIGALPEDQFYLVSSAIVSTAFLFLIYKKAMVNSKIGTA